MSASTRKPSRRLFLVAAVSAMAAACQPTIDFRGYQARGGDLEKVQVGMPKSEVEALLGSPSTKASIALQGDSYYYISSKVEQTAFSILSKPSAKSSRFASMPMIRSCPSPITALRMGKSSTSAAAGLPPRARS